MPERQTRRQFLQESATRLGLSGGLGPVLLRGNSSSLSVWNIGKETLKARRGPGYTTTVKSLAPNEEAILARARPYLSEWHPDDPNHASGKKPIWITGGAYWFVDRVFESLTRQPGQARQFEEWMSRKNMMENPGAQGYSGKCFAMNNYLFHLLRGSDQFPITRGGDFVDGVRVPNDQLLFSLQGVAGHACDASGELDLNDPIQNIHKLNSDLYDSGRRYVVIALFSFT